MEFVMLKENLNVSVVGNAVAIVTNAEPSILVKTRKAFVASASTTGEMLTNYARIMDATFDVKELTTGRTIRHWWELNGKEAKAVNLENEEFVKDMMDVKKSDGSRKFSDSTITVYWGRVKEESGKPKKEKVVSDVTIVDPMTLEDLKVTINRILLAESDTKNKYSRFAKSSDEKEILMDVFLRLGGQIVSGKLITK